MYIGYNNTKSITVIEHSFSYALDPVKAKDFRFHQTLQINKNTFVSEYRRLNLNLIKCGKVIHSLHLSLDIIEMSLTSH